MGANLPFIAIKWENSQIYLTYHYYDNQQFRWIVCSQYWCYVIIFIFHLNTGLYWYSLTFCYNLLRLDTSWLLRVFLWCWNDSSSPPLQPLVHRLRPRSSMTDWTCYTDCTICKCWFLGVWRKWITGFPWVELIKFFKWVIHSNSNYYFWKPRFDSLNICQSLYSLNELGIIWHYNLISFLIGLFFFFKIH